MHTQNFLNSIILIFMLHFTLVTCSCEQDSDCALVGYGLVCSSVQPTMGSCIYACHDDYNFCAPGQKCDHISPHWLCTCNGPADCPDGKCFGGHCIYSCKNDIKCTLCNNEIARSAYLTACKAFLKGVVGGGSMIQMFSACIRATFPIVIETEGISGVICGFLAWYINDIVTKGLQPTCESALSEFCST